MPNFRRKDEDEKLIRELVLAVAAQKTAAAAKWEEDGLHVVL